MTAGVVVFAGGDVAVPVAVPQRHGLLAHSPGVCALWQCVLVMTVRRFKPLVDDVVLVRDLIDRLARTRWPSAPSGTAWAQGTDPAWLASLCADWADHASDPATVGRLSAREHLLVDVEDVTVHVLRAGGASPDAVPLLLTHGWPSAFCEYLPALDLLTEPQRHGLAGAGFEVILASLPGYAWSSRPSRPVTYAETARLWHLLMTELGHEHFGVGGGDFGSGVATLMALQQPERVIGLHLGTLELLPDPREVTKPPEPDEEVWLAADAAYWETGGGYKAIQSTRPQTLAYALTDSPAGLAGWIGEKWHEWVADPGALEPGQDTTVRRALLDVLTVYWLTGCIGPSMRDYHDNRVYPPGLTGRGVAVPTGVPLFADPVGVPPRSWVERLYEVVRWAPVTAGGHFAPAEAPREFAADVCAFFEPLR